MSGLSLPLTSSEQDFLLGCASASIRRGVELPLPEAFAFLAGEGEPGARALEDAGLAVQEQALPAASRRGGSLAEVGYLRTWSPLPLHS